jgi:probable F420-dependent oxidoreductase
MKQIGLGIPLAAPDVRPDTALTFARRAEEAGADSIWSIDRLVFQNYEPLISLAAMSSVTRRARLGTGVLLGALRPPTLLAKMVATLDQVSGGRAILGLGVGGRQDDFAAAEVPFEHRGSRLEEAVRVMKLVWSGQPVRHSGRYYAFDVGPIGPRPAQQPHPPIWFGGGNVESSARRIGRVADGFLASSSSGAKGFAEHLARVRRYAEAAGRDPNSITPAVLTYTCIDDNPDRARELAAAYFDSYYPAQRGRSLDAYPLGKPEACIRAVHEFFEAGAECVLIASVTAQPAHFERLCGEVVPRLR